MIKKSLLFLLLMTLFAPWAVVAQSLTDYTLSTDVTTFNSIVSTGTQLSFSSDDDGYATITFPFAFVYGGSSFEAGASIACSANGFIQLGSTSTSGSTPSYANSNRVITPLPAFDGHISHYSDAGAYWEYDATAGTLTIEYHKLGAYYSPYGSYSYQMVFHTNGNIDFIYDEVDHGTATSRVMATYLTDGPNSDRLFVTGAWATPTKSTSYEARPFTPVPEHGLRYTFTRPVITCPKPTLLDVADADIETEAATIRWTASSASQEYFDIYWSTTNTLPNETTTPSAANQQGDSYRITGLSAANQYYVWIRGNCGTPQEPDISGGWTAARSFVTDCPANYPVGYTCGFEGPNTTSTPLPLCWTRMGSNTSQPNISTYQHYEGSGSLYFYKASSTTYNNEIAALPAIDADLKDLRVVFYGKLSSTSTDGTINVGYVTSLTDATTFQSVETVTLSTSWERHVVSLGNVGNVTGNIAFQALYSTASASIYIDNVTVEEIPSCVEPSGLAEVPGTATESSLTFNWTAGGTETTWKLQYKKSNETDWTTYPNAVTTKPFELTGLDDATFYNVRVAAWCTPSDPDGISSYCEPATAGTECGARTIDAGHHYTENFNDYTATSTSSTIATGYPNDVLPLCWSFLNRSNSSSTYPQVFLTSYSSYAVSGNCLFFKSSKNTPLYAILPEFTNNISDLMLTFTYRNEGTGSSNGKLYVSYMTDPTDATTFSTADAIECAQTTTKTEKEVFFANAPAGSFIAFKYQGGSADNYYLSIDDVTVEPAPNCIKPSALTCNSKTAHTATLSWTNGAATQNAWQIAYSTSSSFAPAADFTANGTTEWLADVTTNPATIEGLAQSTTYYAYVRANCGGGDYSAWCSAKVTFSTIAGNVTPTGLAVDASTITNSQATASWNAVAGNTLHQSYDLYWALATVTAVPDEPAAPNLISGITETSKTITGLAESTDYKVWVRDNCGTDGYSAWSSAVPFSTISSCQTPDALQESDVTTNSAKITWNTYGLTEFNLAYSGDNGTTWETVTGVSCPYTFPNNLEANKPYQVKVQATCNTAEWSTVLSFRTECGPMTITATDYIDEGFEDYEATYFSEAGVIPYCWDNYTTGTYPAPHVVTSGQSYAYTHGGTKSLNFECSANSSSYAALPEFTNEFSSLMVNFWMQTESSSTDYKLSLGYITAEDNNYNTYQVIEEYGNTTTMTERTTSLKLKNVPATADRLVFRWTYTGSSYYACCIDDVVVKLAPTCWQPQNLAASNVTNEAATLTWERHAMGDETEWVLQYGTDNTFATCNEVNVATNPTYEIVSGLSSETTYYARVKPACDTDGNLWSDMINFTTEPDCAVPTNLTVAPGSETAEGATITWNGHNDSFIVELGTYDYTGTPNTITVVDEDLEGGSMPTGWTHIGSGNATYYSSNAHSASHCIQFKNATSNNVLVLPALGMEINTMTISYWSKAEGSSSGEFDMGYVTDPTDASTFQAVHTNKVSEDGYSTYIEVSGISLASAPNGAFIAFRHRSGSASWYWFLDDITITGLEYPIVWTPDGTATNVNNTGEYTFVGLAENTTYHARVKGVCGSNESDYSDVLSFTTLETCPAPTNLTVGTVMSNTATISWNGGLATEWKVWIKESTETEYPTTYSTVNTATKSFDNLIGNTTYDVKIAPTCDETKYLEVTDAFTTDCDAFTVTQSSAYTYDFEDETPWACWTNIAGSNLRSTGTNHTTGGSYKLQFQGTNTGNIIAMPTFTPDINGLMLTFWTRPEGYNYTYCGTFSVGYMTNLADASTFVPVKTYSYNDWSSNTYVEKKVAFTSAPAGAHIAFCHNAGSDNYYWYVDDVKVEIVPSYTKTISGYGNNDGGYVLLTTPIMDVDPATANMIADPEDNYDLFYFDQAQSAEEWRNYKASAFNLEPGKGYLYASKTNVTLTFTGVPYSSSDSLVTITKSDGVTFSGWNLIGNPFLSNVYITDTVSKNLAFYRMNSDGNGFDAILNGAIAPMEGVFVKASAASQSFKFAKTAPVTSPGNGNLNISLAQIVNTRDAKGDTDNAIIRFDNGNTLEKFSFRDNTAKVYIPQDGKDYAVVNADAQGELPVYFKAYSNGNYTLSFTAQDVDFSYLHLIDNLTGNDVDLLATPSYNFDARYTDYAARFKLVFCKGNTNGDDNFGFISNGQLILTGLTGGETLQVIDALGRVITSTNAFNHISIENMAPGVYVLRLINGNDVKTQKIVVR